MVRTLHLPFRAIEGTSVVGPFFWAALDQDDDDPHLRKSLTFKLSVYVRPLTSPQRNHLPQVRRPQTRPDPRLGADAVPLVPYQHHDGLRQGHAVLRPGREHQAPARLRRPGPPPLAPAHHHPQPRPGPQERREAAHRARLAAQPRARRQHARGCARGGEQVRHGRGRRRPRPDQPGPRRVPLPGAVEAAAGVPGDHPGPPRRAGPLLGARAGRAGVRRRRRRGGQATAELPGPARILPGQAEGDRELCAHYAREAGDSAGSRKPNPPSFLLFSSIPTETNPDPHSSTTSSPKRNPNSACKWPASSAASPTPPSATAPR